MTANQPPEGLTHLERIEWWGDKLAASRSQSQFERARVEYNKLVKGMI